MEEKDENTKEKKVVSIEDRIPRLKEERKKKANRRLFFYITIFFILIAFVIYLQSPLSNVKEVVVTGHNELSEEEIQSLSNIDHETNIWMLQKRKAEKNIHNHPLVEKVSIKRELPQTITININEKKIIGYTKEKKEHFPILTDGTIVKEHPMKYRGDKPLLVNFDDSEYMEKIANQLDDLPNHILRLISEVSWEPTDNNKNKVFLYMNDGFMVDASLRDLSNKMKNYPSIIAELDTKEKGIVHMGVGVYFEKIKQKK